MCPHCEKGKLKVFHYIKSKSKFKLFKHKRKVINVWNGFATVFNTVNSWSVGLQLWIWMKAFVPLYSHIDDMYIYLIERVRYKVCYRIECMATTVKIRSESCIHRWRMDSNKLWQQRKTIMYINNTQQKQFPCAHGLILATCSDKIVLGFCFYFVFLSNKKHTLIAWSSMNRLAVDIRLSSSSRVWPLLFFALAVQCFSLVQCFRCIFYTIATD